MKIITDSKAYVQRNDIAYLSGHLEFIPTFLINISEINREPFYCSDRNRWEWVEFISPKEIEWFSNCDCIIDLLSLKDFTDEEIAEQGNDMGIEMKEIMIRYNSMSNEDKQINQQLVVDMDLLEFKIHSLREVLRFRQGILDFEVPEDIVGLFTEVKENNQTEAVQSKTRKYCRLGNLWDLFKR